MDKIQRREQTDALLREIQACADSEKRQALAWRVVLLNDAAATWLARKYNSLLDDGIAEARLALFDAALYCVPGKGTSYLGVARWYYMRRLGTSRRTAGVYVPAATIFVVLRAQAWAQQEYQQTGVLPTLRAQHEYAQTTLSLETFAHVCKAVQVPAWSGEDAMGPFSNPNTNTNASTSTDAPHIPYATEATQEHEHEVDLLKLRRLLGRLSPLEQDAVMSYAGGEDSLRQIGERHGVSREWVNQIRRRVLTQLRLGLRVDFDLRALHPHGAHEDVERSLSQDVTDIDERCTDDGSSKDYVSDLAVYHRK